MVMKIRIKNILLLLYQVWTCCSSSHHVARKFSKGNMVKDSIDRASKRNLSQIQKGTLFERNQDYAFPESLRVSRAVSCKHRPETFPQSKSRFSLPYVGIAGLSYIHSKDTETHRADIICEVVLCGRKFCLNL